MFSTPVLLSLLSCVSVHPGARLGGGPLSLEGLLEGTPRWIDMDASTESVSATPTTFEFVALNGCDNYYRVSFSQSDLQALRAGKISSLIGELEFFNAEVEETTTTITCSR